MTSPAAARAAPSTALVIGTGLIGTSIALALTEHGTQVLISDTDQAAARLAASLGAGRVLDPDAAPGQAADIAVLAVPPGAVARSLAAAQRSGLARCYTDVASVKELPLREASALRCDLATFVPRTRCPAGSGLAPPQPGLTCSLASRGRSARLMRRRRGASRSSPTWLARAVPSR